MYYCADKRNMLYIKKVARRLRDRARTVQFSGIVYNLFKTTTGIKY